MRKRIRPAWIAIILSISAPLVLGAGTTAQAYTVPAQPMQGTFTWTAASGGGYDVLLDMRQDHPRLQSTAWEVVDRVVVTGHALDMGTCTPEPGNGIIAATPPGWGQNSGLDPWTLKTYRLKYDPVLRRVSRRVVTERAYWAGRFGAGPGGPDDRFPVDFLDPSYVPQYWGGEGDAYEVLGETRLDNFGFIQNYVRFYTRIHGRCPPRGDSTAAGIAGWSRNLGPTLPS
jgi:hypothetical protein